MRFEHELLFDAPVERVWAFLIDVPQMASCIPGASGIEPIDETHFDATVATKIGPISAKFGCRITVLEMDATKHTAAVEVAGRDTKLGGGVKAKMTMAVGEIESGKTLVSIASDVDILGKIGQYGHGMISKRADAMLTEFGECARAKLG